jgi:predicted permease
MLWQDVRVALRSIRRRARVSAVVVITLGLGIGAVTALFGVVDAALLRPLPYRAPERLVVVSSTSQGGSVDRLPTSFADFEAWRDRSTSFESMAAWRATAYNLGDGDGARQVRVARVSPVMLATLGVAPALGRDLEPGDAVAGAEPVALVGYGLWQARFAGDLGAVGRSIELDGVGYRVVGVLPREIRFPDTDVELWVPLQQQKAETQRSMRTFRVVARLGPGATIERARAELSAIAVGLEGEAREDVGWGTSVMPLAEHVVGAARAPLLTLFGAGLAVLLVACMNVASLQLAQVASRRHEFTVRAAIGAGRWQLLRQVLVESMLLGAAGGALGAALAAAALEAVVAIHPAGIPRAHEIGVDPWVLAFVALVSLGSGALSGLVPAWRLTNGVLAEALGDGRRTVAGRTERRLLNALVVAEVAIALSLAFAAGLMARSLAALATLDAGFDPHGVMTGLIALSPNAYPDQPKQEAFHAALLERARAVPGVDRVALVSRLPMTSGIATVTFTAQDRPVPPGQEPSADYRAATPDYLDVVGMRIVEGRGLVESDRAGGLEVVVVNETLARSTWPGESALGKRIQLAAEQTRWREVVGVVRDAKLSALDAETAPAVYLPFAQNTWQNHLRTVALVARTSGPPSALAAPLRAVMRDLDPGQALYQQAPFEDVISASLAPRRLSVWLAGIFSALAAFLAVVGVFAVTDYAASQRTREIGLRMALGATPAGVLVLVLGSGARLAVLGVALGAAAALASARLLTGFVYGVSAADPVSLGATAGVLLAVSAIASAVPALRAMRLDPADALRRD